MSKELLQKVEKRRKTMRMKMRRMMRKVRALMMTTTSTKKMMNCLIVNYQRGTSGLASKKTMMRLTTKMKIRALTMMRMIMGMRKLELETDVLAATDITIIIIIDTWKQWIIRGKMKKRRRRTICLTMKILRMKRLKICSLFKTYYRVDLLEGTLN